MDKLKIIHNAVLKVLEENVESRNNDFILYANVLQKMGLPLKISLVGFFASAKKLNAPAFETVSRCRRKIQAVRADLRDVVIAKSREDKIKKFKSYNQEMNF